MAATIAGAGTAIFRLNGTLYSLRASVTIKPLSEERTAGANLDGTLYYTVKPMPATLEADLQDTGDLSIQSFQSFVGGYITIELNNGKVYGFSGALFTGGADLNVAEGTIKTAFAGYCTELTAN